MAANIYEQLSEQLAVTSAKHHQNSLTYVDTVTHFQIEGLLTNPSNHYELLASYPATAASLRSSQPPIQPPVG